MGWSGGFSTGGRVYVLTVAAFLVSFGFSSSASETTERELAFGSLDCPETLTVRLEKLLFRPPYLEREINSTNEFGGLFPVFLEMMLSECCRLSSTVVYNSSDEADADLELPVIVNLAADCNKNKQSNLAPMLPNIGIAFVVIKDKKSNYSLQMMKSLLATWPVLVLTLLLSLIAGIIAWSLETRKNSDDFPSTFTKGTWEGFWWAFISMTTVGYGDRYPRSVGGRLFAVLWILVGICVCSIFTAALTSSLTTLSLETKINLRGSKVVALLDSIEATTGFRHQAYLKRVQTAREMHEQLDSGRVQGALMDAYFLIYFQKHYPTSKLTVQEVIQESKLEYGVRVKDTELASCFREKRYTKEPDLYEFAEMTLDQSLSSGLENEDKHESNLFDPQGMLFFPILFACLGVTTVLIIAGVAWDLWHKFKCCLTKKEVRHGMKLSLMKTSWRDHHATRTKCYVSEEKLQDLEKKIQDVNEALDLIKNGNDKNGNDLIDKLKEFSIASNFTFTKTREDENGYTV